MGLAEAQSGVRSHLKKARETPIVLKLYGKPIKKVKRKWLSDHQISAKCAGFQ